MIRVSDTDYVPHLVRLTEADDKKGGVRNWGQRPYQGPALDRYGVVPSTIGLLVVDVDRSHVNTDSQVLDACAAIAQVIGTPTAIAKSTSGVGRHMLYRVPSHTKAQSQGRAPKALHQYGEVFRGCPGRC